MRLRLALALVVEVDVGEDTRAPEKADVARPQLGGQNISADVQSPMTTAGQAFAEPLDERTPYVPTNTAPRVEDREGGEVNVVNGENRGSDLDLLAARRGGSGASTAAPRSRPMVGGPVVTQVTPQRARSYVRPRRWVRRWAGALVSGRGRVSNRSTGRTRAVSAVGRRSWGAAGARVAPASCTAAATAIAMMAAAQGDRRRRAAPARVVVAARTAATRAAAGVAELRLHGGGGLRGERPRWWVYGFTLG